MKPNLSFKFSTIILITYFIITINLFNNLNTYAGQSGPVADTNQELTTQNATYEATTAQVYSPLDKPSSQVSEPVKQSPKTINIRISAVGDTTLGADPSFKGKTFNHVWNEVKGNPRYFTKNIRDYLLSDDITIANLEGMLTYRSNKAAKPFKGNVFWLKGQGKYAAILKDGGIDVVNLANNHARDFLAGGIQDTKNVLDQNKIKWFDNRAISYINKNGIVISLVGFSVTGYQDQGPVPTGLAREIKNKLAVMAKNSQLQVVMFHWGNEGKYTPNGMQRSLARLVIDNGVDLVLGAHPHVLQKIETYQGRFIVYSLGNFIFGGNRNPYDKDSIIYQQEFEFIDSQLSKIMKPSLIPIKISSVAKGNNYQPQVATGVAAQKIIAKVLKGPATQSTSNKKNLVLK